jgi:hypothetical protein
MDLIQLIFMLSATTVGGGLGFIAWLFRYHGILNMFTVPSIINSLIRRLNSKDSGSQRGRRCWGTIRVFVARCPFREQESLIDLGLLELGAVSKLCDCE